MVRDTKHMLGGLANLYILEVAYFLHYTVHYVCQKLRKFAGSRKKLLQKNNEAYFWPTLYITNGHTSQYTREILTLR